ncbi:kinesin-like protein KIF28P [Liolophura sinensis]|uniref:kinesin-like protein KIF28P n=1 Tax=Liolophura sinensis TaxID=3198878 RepID=UPI0031586D37
MDGAQTCLKDPDNPTAEPRKFAFDYSYWSHDQYTENSNGYLEPSGKKYADQKKVFDDLGRGVLENAWKGYNCSLFAYGQTGSGKSYSMVGYGNNKGIVPLACEELFNVIEKKRSTAGKDEEYQVTLSMLEIYNEQVRDLLNLKKVPKGGLKVRQHPTKGFYVESLTSCPVNSYRDIDAKIAQGTHNRTVASTNMNATSSRAHTIVAVTFTQKTANEAGENMTRTSIINLVDLAGSERAASTGATGDRLKEGSSINQSLSTLGNVIKALADISGGKKKVIVPYRNSVLTRLLQNALGGNSKTIMIAALSPADINYEETLSTLRFADRAKAIKTTAVVNESPTDKLIRELKEENARLLNMLKSGGGAAIMNDQSQGGYTKEEVEEMKRTLEEEMRKSQQEVEEMKKTWQQRLAEAEADTLAKVEEERKVMEQRKVTPHLWNLNEDPSLTAMVIHFCQPGVSTVGNGNSSTPPEILMKGLSIQPNHATLTNKDGVITLNPSPGAKVLVNGAVLKQDTILHHNDRVMFGSNHLYVFHHPADEAQKLKAGQKVDTPTFDLAQEEIAESAGFANLLGHEGGKSKADMLLMDDLVQTLPMVNEANAMSEELNKKVKFEVALVSPQSRGLTDGRTEVMVTMKQLTTGNSWMWDRNKFINRKYLMQEMYQNYVEGDADWDLPKEKDPFWEPADAEILIGTVHLYLQSLAYLIELEDNLVISDYKGNEKGRLMVAAIPCTPKWQEIKDDFVEDPKELLKMKQLNILLKIQAAKGLPANISSGFCQFKFYMDKDFTKTSEVKGTINQDYNYSGKFTFKPVTKQAVDYLDQSALHLEVWGRQKETGFGLGKDVAKLTTKELMTRDKSSPVSHKSPAKVKQDSADGQEEEAAVRKIVGMLTCV